jgi:hypothetical protein
MLWHFSLHVYLLESCFYTSQTPLCFLNLLLKLGLLACQDAADLVRPDLLVQHARDVFQRLCGHSGLWRTRAPEPRAEPTADHAAHDDGWRLPQDRMRSDELEDDIQ